MKLALWISLLFSPLIALANMADSITITDAYLRARLTNVHTTTGYATLTNTSGQDITLVGVSSDKAKKGELHTIVMEQGVARMHEIKSIPLPANATTTLTAGGNHIMLFTVSVPLQPGHAVPVVFHFNDGSSKRVDMNVRDVTSDLMQH